MDSQVLPLSNKNAEMGNFPDNHLLLLLFQVISTLKFTAIQISGMHYNELKLPCTFRIEGASHIQSEMKRLTWDFPC